MDFLLCFRLRFAGQCRGCSSLCKEEPPGNRRQESWQGSSWDKGNGQGRLPIGQGLHPLDGAVLFQSGLCKSGEDPENSWGVVGKIKDIAPGQQGGWKCHSLQQEKHSHQKGCCPSSVQ